MRFPLGVVSGLIIGLFATGKLSVGGIVWNRAAFEQLRLAGKQVNRTHIGGVVIADDVSPELAAEVIVFFRVIGGVVMPKAVADALKGRINVIGGLATR